MKPFVLTPRAEQDIGDIWEYIANDSRGAADRVLAAIEKAILKLARTPGIGHIRIGQPIQVIRILHAAQ